MKKMTTEEFIENYINKFGDKYDFSEFEYLGFNIKSTVICKTCGHKFLMCPLDLKQGHNCPNCKFLKLSKLYKKSKEEFVEECRKVHGDKFDYSEFEYKGNHVKGTIKCNQCGYVFSSMPSNHLNKKQGCPNCSNKLRHTKERFVADSKKIYGEIYSYDNFIYVNGNTKGMVTCPKHGDFPVTPNKHKHGRGCPICRQSYLEREIHTFLENNNINFDYEGHPNDFGKLSLDFFIPEINLAIECQGIQHFKSVDLFGGENAYKQLLKRDNKKFLLCEKNGIKMLYYTKVDNELIKNNSFYVGKSIFTDLETLKEEVINLFKTHKNNETSN